ncbi:hypothetical protein FB45DRAFT_419427 [Roridomyces roridus]|uniref:Uncharacterized protein n=1 Tax=Roridomyces roridus TaxID=1738132 RepID=A0AAD7C513_9AGAR|nr:hypothetical protein FB45DRAFT_419427 [Roridomyces roridus]
MAFKEDCPIVMLDPPPPMFSAALSNVLAFGRSLFVGSLPTMPTFPVRRDDVDQDALSPTSSTRQPLRTRTTSLKGLPTCRPQTCIVTVVSSSPTLSATASIQRPHRLSVPIFVATHSTIEEDNKATSLPTSGITIPRPRDASERAHDAQQRHSIEAEPQEAECSELYDAHLENQILQKWEHDGATTESSEVGCEVQESLSTSFVDTVVIQPLAATTPHFVQASAEETWNDVPDCYSLPPALSSREVYASQFQIPVAVFSPSVFISSVQLLSPAAQRDALQTVAYVACQEAVGLRNYYDHPDILAKLDMAYVWTHESDPLLEFLRNCHSMVAVYHSEHPFFGVPHIVISSPLSEEPWEPILPEQDENSLHVPRWTYLQEPEEGDEQDIDDDGYAAESELAWSESETEPEEARTPSPPSWPVALPSTVDRVQDLFEDDDDCSSDVPSVTEARFRHAWLLDEDDEDYATPRPYTRRAHISRPHSHLSFRKTLSDITETSPEDTYRPLPPDYKSSWTCSPQLPATPVSDSESFYTDARERVDGTETDQSHYVDAPETDMDNYKSSDDDAHRTRANAVPRPSCDIFLNAGSDSDVSPIVATPHCKLPSTPARKFDWSDSLDSDDLGSPYFDDGP